MPNEVTIRGTKPPTADGPLHILDGVAPRIAPDAFIAPTAVVVGRNELWVGVPTRFDRVMSPDEWAGFDCYFREYVKTPRVSAQDCTRHDGEPNA